MCALDVPADRFTSSFTVLASSQSSGASGNTESIQLLQLTPLTTVCGVSVTAEIASSCLGHHGPRGLETRE